MNIFLTTREHEVWALTAQGFAGREIAAKLGIAHGSVDVYRLTLYSKLGVNNAVRATLMAVACGVITVEPRPGHVAISTKIGPAKKMPQLQHA